MPSPCLLIGANGQLGSQLLKDLPGHVIGITRADLDLATTDRSSIGAGLGKLLERHQPQLIVNAAAYTAVDRAQSEPELADQVNAWFPGLIGEMAQGVKALHFSTDYVFDGNLKRPYTEADDTSPLNVYGMSKRKGELAILAAHPDATVLRCSWVVGASGQNFARTILRLACEKESLRVVDDQFGVPTPTPFIAAQVNRWFESTSPSGLYHLVPSGETSWYRYALWILERAASHPMWQSQLCLSSAALIGIGADQYPTLAKRPANSRLDTSKWRKLTGQGQLGDWTEALAPVLKAMLDAGPTLGAKSPRV